MKYLKKFQEHIEYETYIGNNPILPNVSICENETHIHFNAALPTPPTVGHSLGDIAYWDGSKVAFIHYTQWQSSLGTALGVCFIPTSHAAAWGDGKSRFLSVKGVTSTGAAADSEQMIKWDSKGHNAGLTKYKRVPIWDNTIGGSVGSNGNGFISSDSFTAGTQNVIDSLSKYSSKSNMIPSPYAADGSFYADYMREILSGETNVNVLADFNGKANTAAIVAALGADGGEAAKACSLYSTNGIAAGEWYLPAMGELAYIIPRFNVINSALTACNGVLLGSNSYYWSSSECNSSYAYYVYARNGTVYDYHKGSDYSIRPAVLLS